MAVNRESTISHLYSPTGGVQPTPTDLEYGELAINISDGKIFFRGSDDSLKTVNSGDIVTSVNGKTGDVDVVTGYTAQADTPSSANTGDFWLETDTGDLFFYDGSSFVQISGADGPTGPTGPVGDYVESFNGATGVVEGVSSVNGNTGDVSLSVGYEYTFTNSVSSAGQIAVSNVAGDDFLSVHETTGDSVNIKSVFDDLSARGGDVTILKDDGTEVLVIKDISQFSYSGNVFLYQITEVTFPVSGADPETVLNSTFTNGDTAYLRINTYPNNYVRTLNGSTGDVTIPSGITTSSMIFAEETANLTPGRFEFSWGNGGDHTTNAGGIVIPFDCTITAMYMTAETAPTGADIEIYKNGLSTGATVGNSTVYSGNTGISVSITDGDRINLYTNAGSGGTNYRITLRLDQYHSIL